MKNRLGREREKKGRQFEALKLKIPSKSHIDIHFANSPQLLTVFT